MHTDQAPYRQLYDAILDHEGDAPYDDVVRPWLRSADGERRWLEAFGRRRGAPVPAASAEELWRLYALSRVLQLLQLPLAPPVAEPAWAVGPFSADEVAHFADALGLQAAAPPRFHPFHHEIVSVAQYADPDAPPVVVETFWPALMLGPLLVSRAGCRVAAGRRHVDGQIAGRSTLYWAYARNGRRAEDQSAGWGGSSQWRTPFRRDYAIDGRVHYNVDAPKARGRAPDADLTAGERAELLRHRCFVTRAKPHRDRWPYGLVGSDDG